MKVSTVLTCTVCGHSYECTARDWRSEATGKGWRFDRGAVVCKAHSDLVVSSRKRVVTTT